MRQRHFAHFGGERGLFRCPVAKGRTEPMHGYDFAVFICVALAACGQTGLVHPADERGHCHIRKALAGFCAWENEVAFPCFGKLFQYGNRSI